MALFRRFHTDSEPELALVDPRPIAAPEIPPAPVARRRNTRRAGRDGITAPYFIAQPSWTPAHSRIVSHIAKSAARSAAYVPRDNFKPPLGTLIWNDIPVLTQWFK
jgi:hypothetical protein